MNYFGQGVLEIENSEIEILGTKSLFMSSLSQEPLDQNSSFLEISYSRKLILKNHAFFLKKTTTLKCTF